MLDPLAERLRLPFPVVAAVAGLAGGVAAMLAGFSPADPALQARVQEAARAQAKVPARGGSAATAPATCVPVATALQNGTTTDDRAGTAGRTAG